MTPLHWAAQNGHADVVALLLRQGASPNLTNKFDLSPVHIAAQIDRPDIVEMLENAARDPDLATRYLQTEYNGEESNDSMVEMPPELVESEATMNIPIGMFVSFSTDSFLINMFIHRKILHFLFFLFSFITIFMTL